MILGLGGLNPAESQASEVLEAAVLVRLVKNIAYEFQRASSRPKMGCAKSRGLNPVMDCIWQRTSREKPSSTPTYELSNGAGAIVEPDPGTLYRAGMFNSLVLRRKPQGREVSRGPLDLKLARKYGFQWNFSSLSG